MKAGGDNLATLALAEITSQLLDSELIKGHVGVQRVDNPIAKLPV